jgi:regulator of sirC expression with transglutaminase-like and TPR domain
MESRTLARTLFAEAVRAPIGPSDLGRIAALISAEDDPGCGVDETLQHLEKVAAGVSGRLRDLPPLEQVVHLAAYLYQEQGFRGNCEHYYDPRNSLLGQVLCRHRGIPLTLALIAIDVGRRHGVELVPIGLPGHLVVRHAQAADIYLDPFAGDVLTQHQILQRVIGADRLAMLSDATLQPLAGKPFIQRLLTNLKCAYLRSEPPLVRQAFAACERLLLLFPDLPAEVRDRGLFQLHLGRHAAALRDLERYLELAPSAPDRALVTHYVETLYQLLAGLN